MSLFGVEFWDQPVVVEIVKDKEQQITQKITLETYGPYHFTKRIEIRGSEDGYAEQPHTYKQVNPKISVFQNAGFRNSAKTM